MRKSRGFTLIELPVVRKRVLNPERSRRGFTLIELLVVMLIIGLLASMVIINVSNSRKMTRDAKRKADIQSMRTAIEGYYQAHTTYPECSYSNTNSKVDGIERDPTDHPAYDNSLKCIDIAHSVSYLAGVMVPNYLPAMPKDSLAPLSSHTLAENYGSHDYIYVRSVDGESYAFWVQFENPIEGNINSCRTGINMPDKWFQPNDGAGHATGPAVNCPF